MYELINTSIPNGLLPGTHGFSTVAMTKGLPDNLRIRLEALCAYRHRSNAHNATYERENPNNWFHVILPQGVHAVGCVAPADFDYTGRTNRLARIWAFDKEEMPSAGGATVLRDNSDGFREPWSGEARWLDVGSYIAKAPQSIRPADDASAPSWRKMFGEERGLRLARQFSNLLASNISSGGKPICFKTSTDYDAAGTALLNLFADLIDMLPVGTRKSVAFATYPDAFPNGTICHLRGVYDSDRVFETAAATTAWIDCTTKTVHNEMNLPQPAAQRPTADAVRNPAPPTTLAAAPKRRGNAAEIAPSPKSVRRSSPYLPPPETGTGRLLTGILATVATLAVAAVVAVMLWIRADEPHSSLLEQQEETPIGVANSGSEAKDIKASTTPEQETNAGKANDDAGRQYEQEKSEETKKEDERKEAAAKAAKETMEKAAEEQRRKDKEEADRKAREKAVAFTKAKKIAVGRPKEPEAPKSSAGADAQKYEYAVFCYLNGNTGLTNCIARYDAVKFQGKVKNFKLVFNDVSRGSRCSVWYDGNTAWYDFLHTMERSNWFKDADSHDLRKECFGECREMHDTWARNQPDGSVRYKITAWEKGRTLGPWECRADTFAISNAIEALYKSDIKQLEREIEDIKNKIDTTTHDKIGSKIVQCRKIANHIAEIQSGMQLNNVKKQSAKNKNTTNATNAQKQKIQPDKGGLEREAKECERKMKDLKEAVEKRIRGMEFKVRVEANEMEE